jgi:hypothetical protein
MAEATSRCTAYPIRLSERSERASRDAVRRLAAQYVGDHNDLIPRVELGGRTPTEAYEGRPAPALEDACREARARRLEANRRASCGVCDEPPCERVEP